MQKHRGDEREVDWTRCVKWEMRRHSWQRRLRNTMCQCHRHNRIREHECLGVRAKRYLVEKYYHVYSDEPPRYPGKTSSRPCIVLDRNHVFFPLNTILCLIHRPLLIVANLVRKYESTRNGYGASSKRMCMLSLRNS